MSLKQSLKLPSAPKDKIRNITKLPILVEGEVVTDYTQKDVRPIFQKLSYPIFLDLSEGIYLLESDDFMKSCTNVVKELNLSSNSLIEINSLSHLSKLKRLILNRNNLIEFSVQGLSSLCYLGLCNNRIDRIPDMGDCKKLVNIDLSGNRLTGEGFDNFSKLKSLRVLDVSSNSINCSLIDFQKKILEPLKKSKTLEYLSFENNMIEKKYEEFKLFVINELPKLKYLNWVLITKEDRAKASKLESDGFFNKQLSIISVTPIQNLPTPSIPTPSSNNSSTSNSVSASPNIKGIPPASPNRSTSFVQRKPSIGANMMPKLNTSLNRSTDFLGNSNFKEVQQSSQSSQPQQQQQQQQQLNDSCNSSAPPTPLTSPVNNETLTTSTTSMSPFDILQSKVNAELSHSSSSSNTTASQILQEIKSTDQLTKQETEDYMDILLNELQPNNNDYPTSFAGSVIDQKVYLDLLYRAIIDDAINPDELIQECYNNSSSATSSVIASPIITTPIAAAAATTIINMPDEEDELINMPDEEDELPPVVTQVVSVVPSLVKESSREALFAPTFETSTETSTTTTATTTTVKAPTTPPIAKRLPTLEETIESVVTAKPSDVKTTTATPSAKDIWVKIDQNASTTTTTTTGSPQTPNRMVPKRLPSNLNLNNNNSNNNTPPPNQSILKPVAGISSPSSNITQSPMKPMTSKPIAKVSPTTNNGNNSNPSSPSRPLMKPMIKKPPAISLSNNDSSSSPTVPVVTPIVTTAAAAATTTTTTPIVEKSNFTSEIDKALADIDSWAISPTTPKSTEQPIKPIIPQELLSTISKQKVETQTEKVENASSKLDEMIMEYQNSPQTSPTNSRRNQSTSTQQLEQPIQKMINNETNRIESMTSTIIQPLPNWLVPNDQIKLGSKLGLGSFGDCFSAHCFGIPTILKKLRTQRFSDQFLGQFQSEVMQVRELQHENLVPISGCCVDTNIYVVHPYYDASSLQTLLLEPTSFNVTNEFIHRVALGISKAMTYLHSHDVIHRALKLNNILIERSSGNVLVRDYAFTFVKDGIFRTGQQGSPYLAPELFNTNCNQYDTSSDQFGFAMVLLQLFTRSPLYADIHVTRITDAILNGTRPDIPDNVPTVFNRLIRACWNADPAARPSFLTISKILSQPFQRIFALSPSASIAKPTISNGTTVVQPNALNQSSSSSSSSSIGGTAKHQFSETGELNKKMILVLERIVSMLSTPHTSIDSVKRALKALENLSSPENHSTMVGIGLMGSLRFVATNNNTLLLLNPDTEEQLLHVIYSLCTNEQLSNEFIMAGGFTPLSNWVASSNPAIALLAIKLVSVLSDEQHLHHVKSTGILETLTQILLASQHIHESIITQSVGAMSRILLNEDNQNQFISSGGVSALLNMLLNSSNSLSMRALLALCCLISNPNCKSQLHNAGIIPKLMELLSSSQKLLKLHSLKVIETMAKDIEFRKLLIQEECLALLVYLLSNTNANDTEVIASTLSCIGSMMKNQLAYDSFFNSNGINVLIGFISYNQQIEILESLFPVYCSAINHEASRNQLLPTISKLVELLSNSNLVESVIISILKCLTQFSIHSTCIEAIEQQASVSISIVSTLLLRNDNNKDIKIHSLRFISSLAKVNSKLAANIHVIGGILQILVNNLNDENNSITIKEEVISTISWLVTSAECRSVLLQKNVLSLFISNHLNTRNIDVIERLIWAISFFALDESAQSIIRESSNCMQFIVNCLDRHEDVFKTLSIKTVLILVQKPINHQALKKVGVDFQLQVLSSSSNRSIQLASKKILSLLN